MALTQSSLLEVVFDRGSALAACDDDITIVWLRGEHDLSTRAALSHTFASAIAASTNDLVVDLSEVQFLDASTIGALSAAREYLCARSRALTLRCPSRIARRLLDICGLADLVEADPVDVTAPGAALRSWVAVPAAPRLDRPGRASGEDDPASGPPCAVAGATAPQQRAVADRRRSPGGAGHLAGRGRP